MHCSFPVPRKNQAVPSLAAILKRFQGWHAWAIGQPDLNAVERELARGPRAVKFVWDRANVSGVRFTAELLESKKKAKDSIIMISTPGFTPSGKMFGRVQGFVDSLRPGGSPCNVDDQEQFVEAKWFKTPSTAAAAFNNEIGCPVVLKTTYPLLEHGLWPAADVTAVHIGLAPFININGNVDHTRWQVLAADPDFLTRKY